MTDPGFMLILRRIGIQTKRLGRLLRTTMSNHNIFGFFVFLCVAVGFWFSQTFKENTTVNIDYQLQLVNVPSSYIFTSDVPKTVSVTLSGRGFALLQYVMRQPDKTLQVDFADLTKMGGIVTLDNQVWRKIITKQLPAGVSYTAVAPSMIEIYYSMGDHKQIPVVFNGKIRTSNQHILCGLNVKPEYVDIYAPSPQFDTLQAAMTEPLVMNDIEDTITIKLALQKVKGVKMKPDSVEVQACVDLFTTKTVRVPIYTENIPPNKIIRTFPLMADVTFKVSATMFNTVLPEDFIVVVDYNSIHQGDTKCRLQIRETPDGIYNAKVNPAMIDFVIEQE